MPEYIEREELERSLNERLNRLFKVHGRHDHYVQGFDDCVGRVEEFPAADVATVRHGRWLGSKHKIFSNTYDYVCSNCGCDYALAKYNYCPSCGAKMQEVE